MAKGNRGEWSELYTFFKLLSDGKLYAADSQLNKIDDMYYPIIKILRKELASKYEYTRAGVIKIISGTTKQLLCEVPIKEFEYYSGLVLDKIKRSKKTTFDIKEAEPFMEKIYTSSIKAASLDKSDITLMVHDMQTGLEPILGFSIKSRLGSPSTLFNASTSTNFIFRVTNIDDPNLIEQINNINTKSKIRDRLKAIKSNQGSIVFYDIDNGNFKNNLQIIDSSMPLILSNVLLNFYSGNGNKLNVLTEILEQENPCNFSSSSNHEFYKYKIKSLLTDIAVGMTPATVWTGSYDATGGYIIVKEDGELLCYHIYNRNEFQDYLLQNTKLDTPSSSRNNFGKLFYGKDNEVYLRLNLQIRFLK